MAIRKEKSSLQRDLYKNKSLGTFFEKSSEVFFFNHSKLVTYISTVKTI